MQWKATKKRLPYLPDDMMHEIFTKLILTDEHIHTLRQVSRRWRELLPEADLRRALGDAKIRKLGDVVYKGLTNLPYEWEDKILTPVESTVSEYDYDSDYGGGENDYLEINPKGLAAYISDIINKSRLDVGLGPEMARFSLELADELISKHAVQVEHWDGNVSISVYKQEFDRVFRSVLSRGRGRVAAGNIARVVMKKLPLEVVDVVMEQRP